MTMTRDRIEELKRKAAKTTDGYMMLVEPADVESLLALAERALEPQGQALPELPEPVQDVRAMFRGEVDSFVAMDIYITGEQAKKYGQECYNAGRASQLALPAGPVRIDGETVLQLLNHIEDMVDETPETVRLWNAVTSQFASSPSVAQPVPDYLHAFTAEAAQRDPRLQEYTLKSVAQPVADERSLPKEIPTFPDDDAGRKAFVLGYNAALKDARAVLCQPAEEGGKS